MRRTRAHISISQALFTFFFLLFFFTLLNGYLLNLVGGYRADARLVLAGVVLELGAPLWFARTRVSVEFDSLELAGFLVVVVGVWSYFVAASWPTLLPPTQSMDAVRHYLFALFSYPDGRLVSWYPAGGAFLAAVFAHWLGWDLLRVLHPTAAVFIALSAGAVYGLACALLPRRRLSKIAALAAPALLFVPWSYFAGIVDWQQYFYAQVVAQYFVLSAIWCIADYAAEPRWLYAALAGAALLCVVAAYPYLVGLPLAVFAMVTLAQLRSRGLTTRQKQGATAVLVIFLLLLVAAAIALQHGGILEPAAAAEATTHGVGEGGVTNPSVDALGGPIFLLLALVGVPLAWRSGAQGKTVLALLLAWLAQFVVILFVQPYINVSGYRVDKTFYVLVFPLAILAALVPARLIERWGSRLEPSGRAAAVSWLGTAAVLGVAVIALRPPVSFSPFGEAELQAAQWAREHLDTYQISYLDPSAIRSYWLAFGIWGEKVPNEWFQWIPPGTKLGPATFEDWLRDPAWPQWVLVRPADLKGQLLSALPTRIVYQNGEIAILEKQHSTLPAPTISHPALWDFASAIKLIGYDIASTRYSPGESISLTTLTESERPPTATVGWRIELLDRTGRVVSKTEGEPFANKYPLQRWPPGQYARDRWTLTLDPATPPGLYDLRMGLYSREDGAEVEAWFTDPDTGQVLRNVKPLGAAPLVKVKVLPPVPSANELAAAVPLDARVGDHIVLSSYSLEAAPSSRVVRLTLFWQCLSTVQQDYTVFVHLVDSSGKIVGQVDSQPLGGNYPTSAWDAQQIIKDSYTLVIPGDAPASSYDLEIGMYQYPSLQRLAVNDGDHVTLRLTQ